MDRGLRWPTVAGFFFGLFFWWIGLFNEQAFDVEYSTAVYASSNELLGARLGSDQQWRFPSASELPPLYKEALLTFEDKRFYTHFGIDFWAFGRAMFQNIQSGRVISGGSTITMQLARILLGNQSRTPLQKLREMALATRLEWVFSKDEILWAYSSRAPFGGNIVGLEAASWRYFQSPSSQLSISESVLLAVLPNAPGQLAPGRNGALLKERRDWLLDELEKRKHINALQRDMAKLEPIPEKPKPLPNVASHFVEMLHTKEPGKSNFTTIDFSLQREVEEYAHQIQQRNALHGVENLAILVADVATGNVLAYIGNAPNGQSPWVDIIQSPRSSGSILKPFLFCHLYNEGMLVQETLVPDYPIFLNGFNPENFDKSYRGALPAREALAQSLNIPAVLLLKKMGVEPFKGELERWGFTTLRRPSSEYGLSLILGGAEVTLWDAVGAYASMGRVLGGFTYNGSQYDPHSVHPLKFKPEKSKTPGKLQVHPTIAQAGAIQWVLQDLLEVNRPDEVLESGLKPIQGISWKTGTSFGHRDAWAIGLNQSYAIGVWVGNASGEGRNGLIGARYAAPVLFDLFRRLGGQPFEPIPLSNMVGIEICRQSGYLAGPYCEDTKELMALPKTGNMGICPFHEVVIGNNSMVELVFTLPPVMAHFFDKHPSRSASNGKNMDFIYPNDLHYIALPMDENGTTCSAVFELAHRIPLASVYWYLDGRLIKTTSDPHTLPVEVPAGKHTLLVVDQFGEEENLEFEVLPN